MIRSAAISAMLMVVTAGSALADCSESQIDLRGDWGQARFTVEVADDAQERSVGLMDRPSMATGAGMLFVYERPQRVSFWMRNTLIPLDMIFIGETGVVSHIHSNAVPLDETSIPGGDQVQFVLEINGGLSDRLGISIGSEVRHPAIGPNAEWSCK